MRLTDRDREPWTGQGVPTHVEFERDEDVGRAVRQVPPQVLAGAWAAPWTSRGVDPPARTVGELRAELETRARAALTATPSTALVPVSEYAYEMGVPERTLRSQIARGVRQAQRRGNGDLALELPVKTPLHVPLPRSMPDPRVLMAMASVGVQPGASYTWRLSGDDRDHTYRRRTDGENWREFKRL